MPKARPQAGAGLLTRPIPLIPAAHGELLRREFRVNVHVRFVVATILVGGGLAVWAGSGPAAPGALVVAGLGLFVGLYNGVLLTLRRRLEAGWERDLVADAGLLLHYAAVFLDVVVLAAVISFLGGVRSPFMTVYFLHLALSCFLYPRRAAAAIAGLIILLVAIQALLESGGLAPGQALPGIQEATALAPTVALGIVVVYGTVIATLAGLLIPTARWVRSTQLLLERQRDELAARSRLRRDFLQLAVHNLRSPLAASLMHLENLESGMGGELTEVQHRWLGRMGARMAALMEMLDGLQTLAQIEVASLDTYAEPVDVNELLTQLAHQYEVRAEDRGLTLLLDLDPELPQVHGIAVLLHEALANYVANAVKYASAPGTVTLRARARAAEPGRSLRVRVEVADLGPGVPAAYRDQLFQEFARIPRPGNDGQEPKGSGLGLSLVKRIAEFHGGRVGVETREGGPSTFWLEIPAEPQGSAVSPSPAARSPESAGASAPESASEAHP